MTSKVRLTIMYVDGSTLATTPDVFPSSDAFKRIMCCSEYTVITHHEDGLQLLVNADAREPNKQASVIAGYPILGKVITLEAIDE